MRSRVVFAVMVALVCLTSCSTKKNTAMTRFWHSFTAKYNTMYNGQVAFDEGVEAQMKGHRDDYTRLLPVYECQRKESQGLGAGNFETAILKSEKAIKLHSIKKRPVLNPNRKKTPQMKEFLQRKEFNPYLWRAWFMLAESQFRRGEFIESSATWNYIIRLYATQPNIVQAARARLARCYVALEWPYDADDVLRRISRDSLSAGAEKEKTETEAAYFVLTGQYAEAIPRLQKTITNAKGRMHKARLNFLLAQLYRETGDNARAYKSLAKVVNANPPYEMAFAARVLQTEVMSKGKYKQMIRRLRRMARDENNKDYLDQIYYAIGNIHLSIPDTAQCIAAWEKGVEESTQSGPAKAMLLLKLSELYWQKENYIDAARTYTECSSALDKDHEQYKEVQRRAKALQPLAPHLEAVKLQDSLQALAKLPEAQYLAAIDRVIEALKKKEKEEAKKAARNEDRQEMQQQRKELSATAAAQTNRTGGAQRGGWYFYNPTTLASGKTQFRKVWGERKNEDNWRRSNKTILSGAEFEEYGNAQGDSLAVGEGEQASDEKQAEKDSLANDPHNREFYLRQIPFTPEAMEESEATLEDALMNAGVILQGEVENFAMAKRTLERLMTLNPEFGEMEKVYYHMFLVCGRMGLWEEAEMYRQRLVNDYAQGDYGKILSNPNYERIATNGKHMEDSLYQASYRQYMANEYDQVHRNWEQHKVDFPEGAHTAKMMFVEAMSQLYSGDRKEFLTLLKELVQKYSKDEISELAARIVKGVQDGRLLQDGPWDASDIWGRRSRDFGEGSTDSIPELTEERLTSYVFLLAYPTGSLDEDQLLFEVARYNFTSFMVRNFDLEISDLAGVSMLAVKGFASYDEVHAYAQQLYGDEHMRTVLDGIRSLLISEENMKLLGVDYSFDDYENFFEEKIRPSEVKEDLRIDDNQQIEDVDPEDVPEGYGTQAVSEEDEEIVDEDDFPFGF